MKLRSILSIMAVSAALVAACEEEPADDDDGGGSPPTPAERMCNALAEAIAACGMATACDQALVQDCAAVVGIFSDPYLDAAATCIEGGGIPQQCLVDALGSLAPTAAHQAFAAQFCSECALGVPGCEEAIFGGGDGDVAVAGKLILPFGDALVGELAAECATGLTCAATFLSCAQGVLAKRAIPEATLTCMIDTLTGNVDPGMGSTCSSSASGGG